MNTAPDRARGRSGAFSARAVSGIEIPLKPEKDFTKNAIRKFEFSIKEYRYF